MGMDVFGKEPISETGEYFRRNIWGWRPLAELVTTLCPKETAACEYWWTNDGDGLDAAGARALASALQDKINQGAVLAYIKIREAELEAMPNDSCDLCEGTGIRCDEAGIESGHPEMIIPNDAEWNGGKHPRSGQVGSCNGCDGSGFERPFETNYEVEEDDVRDFISFLRDSGGFAIY